MKCRICNGESNWAFKSIILGDLEIDYFFCDNCGFLQTEEPYWLGRAYINPINIEDTGILSRNIRLRNITSAIIWLLFNKQGQFLDYGGGHGIFTRLMRDTGYDFYWTDKYAENIFSRGFEYKQGDDIELITCFECFEHLEEPQTTIEAMLRISRNILFSTEILPVPVPSPSDWWYYGLSHGQHISFYSLKTLQYIADKYGLNLYSLGDIHLLTENKVSIVKKTLLKPAYKASYLESFRIKTQSKAIEDMNYIISSK
ncbi:class I SAM-dependent methyltransferase [Methanolobus sp.]|uniref:class I SAM-dependent methyltransferase n=1 Tax=Methanolobus sp. TaxID=1874737 RepID=UPI0025DA58A5|nr:class I SAM-dependent methyltransferase [Methanolobus sp.]